MSDNGARSELCGEFGPHPLTPSPLRGEGELGCRVSTQGRAAMSPTPSPLSQRERGTGGEDIKGKGRPGRASSPPDPRLLPRVLRHAPQIGIRIVPHDVDELGPRRPVVALAQQLDEPQLQVGIVDRVV
jgi:hypothetical protein